MSRLVPVDVPAGRSGSSLTPGVNFCLGHRRPGDVVYCPITGTLL